MSKWRKLCHHPTFFFVYPASHVTVMTKESPDRPDVILPREPRTVVAAAPLVFLGNLTVRHDAPYRLKSVAFFLFEKKKKKCLQGTLHQSIPLSLVAGK